MVRADCSQIVGEDHGVGNGCVGIYYLYDMVDGMGEEKRDD